MGRSAALTLRPRPLVVHTYHGHVLEGYFGRGKTAVFRNLEKAAGRISDRLVGVSQATVDDLVRLGIAPRDRFRVVPLGLDLDPFARLAPVPDFQARRHLGIESDDTLFCFIGRIVPIKRVDLLLMALAKARQNGARAQLALVGDGEMRPRLEDMARGLGIRDSVHFLGYRRDLATIVAASDAAILSSDNEGTPVSLIEASAAARPALATTVGGVPDVVTEETGILVQPGDTESLAAGIERLASDPDLREAMGRRAREHAVSRFSAGRLVDDIDSLYRELLSRRPELLARHSAPGLEAESAKPGKTG